MNLTEYQIKDMCSVLSFSAGLMGMLSPVEESVVIHASLDDVSTDEHGGMSAVVGYIAHTPEWNGFNTRWWLSLMQLRNEADPYLHTAKDLSGFALIGGNGMTDEDVYLILQPYIAIVQEELLRKGAFCICIITEKEGYEKLSKKEQAFIRPPEINSFEVACALALRSVSSPQNPWNRIAIQMDEAQNAPELYKSYENMKRKDPVLRDGFGSICFCDDRYHPPIQAADLLANVVLRAWRSHKLEQKWPRAFNELVHTDGKPNISLQVYTHDSLKSLARIRMSSREKMLIPENAKRG